MTDSNKAAPDLLRPFKVGDKVCDPIRYGNGEVIRIYEEGQVCVKPVLDSPTAIYSHDGFYLGQRTGLSTLFHGHMEEGSGKVTFTPKKEPVYEWQWEYVSINVIDQRKSVWTTGFFQNEKAMLEAWANDVRKDFIRIERSKREVIN